MFHFVRLRKIWYIFSIVIIAAGMFSLFTRGLNLGIDFTGGNIIELHFEESATIEEVRDTLGQYGLAGSPIQQSGDANFIVRTAVLSQEQNADLIAALEQNIGDLEVMRNNIVGPTIGKELRQTALISLAIASVLMLIYISWRFEFLQGVSALIAILHDVLLTVGILSIIQAEIDSTFVAAILTIIGYSINNTIIIFDRIRENLTYSKKGQALEDIVNDSLWQTLARSFNTTITTLFVLVALFFFGGATIKYFVLAMIIGVTSGFYTSLCLASPLWLDIKNKRVARA